MRKFGHVGGGLGSTGLAPRWFGVKPCSEPLRRALRHADRCEGYRPSRRSSRPTSPGRVQRSASSTIRSRYSAVSWRRVGLATTSGSGARRACPVSALGGLVAPLLAPQGRRVNVHPRHGLSVCSHRDSPPPPSTHSKATRCLDDVGREGAAGYREAIAERTALTREWNLFLDRYPLVLCPFLLRSMYAWDYDAQGFEQVRDLFRSAIYSTGVSYLSLPAGVVPIGFADGRPAGVQIVGRRFREDLILDAMEAIESSVGVLSHTLWEREDGVPSSPGAAGPAPTRAPAHAGMTVPQEPTS